MKLALKCAHIARHSRPIEEKSRNKVGVLENAPGLIIFVVEDNFSFSRWRSGFKSQQELEIISACPESLF